MATRGVMTTDSRGARRHSESENAVQYGTRRAAGRRRRQVVAIMTGVLVGVLIALLATPAQARPPATEVGGSIWSGIIDRGAGLLEVHTRVTVPRVSGSCSARSNAAVWVGLGGYGRFPFAQNGITLTPSGIGAWYELFDGSGAGPVVTVPVVIRTGDVLELDLHFTSNHQVLIMTWNNLTRHQLASRRLTGAARWYNGSTAEWIVERAAYDYRHDSPYFARFAPITFTSAWTRNANGAGRSAFPNDVRSELIGKGTYHKLTTTTPHSSQSFTTTWRACH